MTYPATNINQLPTLPPTPYCDCGRLKEPGDFLCWRCRRDIELEYAALRSGKETP